MRHSQEFLITWLIAPERFERWVNVLADNDDTPATPGLELRPEEIPTVSGLSFY
jgi:hypothetical protein